MLRFLGFAFPTLLLLLAFFGVAIEALDLEPRQGAVIRLAVLDLPSVAPSVVLAAWVMEACGLIALFLVTQGRLGAWWLDGLAAGWLAWVFRGPVSVVTIVVATRQPQDAWWQIAFGWWLLYSLCGLTLAVLARSLATTPPPTDDASDPEPDSRRVDAAPETS
ncbi:MAG: hypothetical protein AAGC60_11405 [Acidobacteriota bacterium]